MYVKRSDPTHSFETVLELLKRHNLLNEVEKEIECLDSALQDYDLALIQLEQNHIEH